MRMIKTTIDSVGLSKKPTDQQTIQGIQYRLKQPEATKEMTSRDLLNTLSFGYSFKPAVFNGEGTKKQHFLQSDILGVDIDTGRSIQDSISLMHKYRVDFIGIYKTHSFTEENQKHRIIFELPYTVVNMRVMELLQQMAISIFNGDEACSDCSRLFYGGKEGEDIIWDSEKSLNLANFYTAFMEELKIKDPRNLVRKLTEIGSKCGLNLVNGKLDIDIIGDDIKPNFRVESLSYKTTGKRYGSIEKAQKSYNPDKIKGEYGTEVYDLSKLEGSCKLYKDFTNGSYWVSYPEYTHLIYNLYLVEGGVQKIKNTFQQYPAFYNGSKSLYRYLMDTDSTVNSCIRDNYLPQNCIGKCEFYHDCELIQQGYKNPYDYLKNSRANIIEYVGNAEPKPRQSVEHVRNLTQEAFNRIIKEMAEVKQGLYVLKSPTGIGKTEILTSFDWNDLGKRVAFALPTHKLKDEFIGRCEEKGLHIWGKPEIVNFSGVGNGVQQRIDILYSKKLYKQAKLLYLNELEKHTRDNKDPLYQLCKAYEHDTRLLKYQTLIATTHRDILLNPEGYDIIIYDEDILWTSMEQGKIVYSSFETIVNMMYAYFKDGEKPEITTALKQFKDSEEFLLDLTGLKMADEEIQKIQNLNSITSTTTDIAIMGIYTADYILKIGNESIIYGKRTVLSNKPSLVLSATANETIYKGAYPDINFTDVGNAHDDGKIIQYLDKSYSRSYIAKMNMNKIVQGICEILGDRGKLVMDYTLLTYSLSSEKEFVSALKNVGLNVDENVYFGNCSGYDHLKAQHIAVVGTPNYPVDSYRMMALLIFGNRFDVMAEFETGKRVINEFKKKYATFTDETLQAVQKYAVETELLQAIGRARLLNRDNVHVLVLSGYPLNEADVVHYSGKTIIK